MLNYSGFLGVGYYWCIPFIILLVFQLLVLFLLKHLNVGRQLLIAVASVFIILHFFVGHFFVLLTDF